MRVQEKRDEDGEGGDNAKGNRKAKGNKDEGRKRSWKLKRREENMNRQISKDKKKA